MTSSLPCNVTSLTPSELGALLQPGGSVTNEAIRGAALTRGVALVKNTEFTEDTFRDFVTSLGGKVRYEDDDADVGYGFSDILHLDGTHEARKVITGRGALPLHTDGVLLGTQVDLIVLYATEVDGLADDGATLVCDQISAWPEMPEGLRSVLRHGRLEYRAIERGYFTSVPSGWYPIPTFRDYGRVRSLNIALPFSPQWSAAWQVRVPGASADESASFFESLRDHLSQDRYLYRHRWRQGDLLVIDNQRTLHGRCHLSDAANRKLLRGQVTLDPVEGAPGATSEGM
ncbi:MAG: TauD/TfdA family dioxygenase [Pseudonocardiales bacterium]